MSAPQNAATFNVARGPGGKFLPGSGGRPPGSRNKISTATLAAVKDLAGSAVAVLRARLAENDLRAAELVLSHILPRGGRVVELDSTDPLSIGDAIAAGEISPDEAGRIGQALAKLHDVAELADLRARLDELEAMVRR